MKSGRKEGRKNVIGADWFYQADGRQNTTVVAYSIKTIRWLMAGEGATKFSGPQ